MKFKVSKGTETFKKLQQLMSKIEDVDAQAKKVVKKLGGKEYASAQRSLAGGIAAIQFDEKPEGYKMVGEKWQRLYYPKATNKKDLNLISDLPTIEYAELNDIVGFKGPQTTSHSLGLAWVSSVGLAMGKTVAVIEVAEGCKYSPPKDILEIKDSEYQRIKKKIEANNNK